MAPSVSHDAASEPKRGSLRAALESYLAGACPHVLVAVVDGGRLVSDLATDSAVLLDLILLVEARLGRELTETELSNNECCVSVQAVAILAGPTAQNATLRKPVDG